MMIDYARNFRHGKEEGWFAFKVNTLGLFVIRYGSHPSGWAKPSESVYTAKSLEPDLWP